MTELIDKGSSNLFAGRGLAVADSNLRKATVECSWQSDPCGEAWPTIDFTVASFGREL
jgi:hypothetical protein